MTIEVEDFAEFFRKPKRMMSKSFLKREPAKSRLLYPLDIENSIYFGYLAYHLGKIVNASGQTELGKSAAAIGTPRTISTTTALFTSSITTPTIKHGPTNTCTFKIGNPLSTGHTYNAIST